MKTKYIFSALVVGLFAIVLGTSCEKKTDCKLTVKVVDSVGMPIAGAAVKVYANVKTATGSSVEADLKADGVSDGSGNAAFTFKLPAILDVKAVFKGKTGVGIVKLEEGKSVDKSVTIK